MPPTIPQTGQVPPPPPQAPTDNLNNNKINPAIGGDTEEKLVFLLQDIEDRLDKLTEIVTTLQAESKDHKQNLSNFKQETQQNITASTKNVGDALKQHISNVLYANPS